MPPLLCWAREGCSLGSRGKRRFRTSEALRGGWRGSGRLGAAMALELSTRDSAGLGFGSRREGIPGGRNSLSKQQAPLDVLGRCGGVGGQQGEHWLSIVRTGCSRCTRETRPSEDEKSKRVNVEKDRSSGWVWDGGPVGFSRQRPDGSAGRCAQSKQRAPATASRPPQAQLYRVQSTFAAGKATCPLQAGGAEVCSLEGRSEDPWSPSPVP